MGTPHWETRNARAVHHVIAAKMQDATRGQADEQALTQVHHRVSLSGQFFARHRADSSTTRACLP